MLKGFRDFIMRGNIIDLAIAVVIGVAFNSLVTKFTDDFIKPLVNLAGGGGKLSGSWHIRGVEFAWADFINAIINFVIIAAVLYFLVVVPMNRFNDMRRRGVVAVESPVPPTDEAILLTEIRDILVAANGGTVAPGPRRAGESSATGDAMPPRP